MSDYEKASFEKAYQKFEKAYQQERTKELTTLRAELERVREQRKALHDKYYQLIQDDTDDDTTIRDLARPILGEHATDGDSDYVPSMVNVVEELAKKFKRIRAMSEKRRKALNQAANDLWLANKSIDALKAKVERVRTECDELKEKERKVQIKKNALVVVLRKCADALTAALKGEKS